MRSSKVVRETKETKITLSINLDGTGVRQVKSGCGFLDHMLDLFAYRSDFDMDLYCDGDLNVDAHHTTEDIGIVLGQAIKDALGDKKGIVRYGEVTMPMDEALILVSLDISGRGGAYLDLKIPAEQIGNFETELCAEFLHAFARASGITLHVRQLAGDNSHHIIEGVFKGLGRALKQAVSIDFKHSDEVPSTKGKI